MSFISFALRALVLISHILAKMCSVENKISLSIFTTNLYGSNKVSFVNSVYLCIQGCTIPFEEVDNIIGRFLAAIMLHAAQLDNESVNLCSYNIVLLLFQKDFQFFEHVNDFFIVTVILALAPNVIIFDIVIGKFNIVVHLSQCFRTGGMDRIFFDFLAKSYEGKN